MGVPSSVDESEWGYAFQYYS